MEQQALDVYKEEYAPLVEDKKKLSEEEHLWQDHVDSAARDLLASGQAKGAVGRFCLKRLLLAWCDKLDQEKVGKAHSGGSAFWDGIFKGWDQWLNQVVIASTEEHMFDAVAALFEVLSSSEILTPAWGQGGDAGESHSPRAIWRLDFEFARQGCLGSRGASCVLFTLLWRLRSGLKHQYWVRKAGTEKHPPKPALYERQPGSGLRTLRDRKLHADSEKSAKKIYECHRGCLCACDCLNRAAGLQGAAGSRPRLAVCRFAHKGWGLICQEAIPANTYVGSYTGLIQPKEHGSISLAYTHTLADKKGREIEFDTQHFGNETRFLNHSCEPNLRKLLVFNHLHTHPHLAFFTMKDVAAGTELCITYGSGKGLGFTCRCGAWGCKSKKAWGRGVSMSPGGPAAD